MGGSMALKVQQDRTTTMAKQMAFLFEQEAAHTPLSRMKIRCECGDAIPWWQATKCPYCGVFCCPKCAVKHLNRPSAQLAGGKLVSSRECTPQEILAARIERRLFYCGPSHCFIWIPGVAT